MERLVLVTVGELDFEWIDQLYHELPLALGRKCRIDPLAMDAAPALNLMRRQHDAAQILRELEGRAEGPHERVFGLTGRDLYASVFTFVFGAATLGGSSAVVSTQRLDPRHYGLEADAGLMRKRLLTEAIHECGHMYGARHCPRPDCAMHFSAVVEEIDLKAPSFCEDCAGGIGVPPGQVLRIHDQGA